MYLYIYHFIVTTSSTTRTSSRTPVATSSRRFTYYCHDSMVYTFNTVYGMISIS